MEGFSRHITACNNAELPGARLPFLIGETQVGWVGRDVARMLGGYAPAMRAGDDALRFLDPDTGRLNAIARKIASRLGLHWRDERFDIRATQDGPVLAEIDRAMIPVFGIEAQGVHVNGLVRRDDGWHLWVARRAADRPLDPGKLDHVVAGGIAAGMTPWGTLLKEAREEAAIPEALARTARPAGTVSYTMERPEGLRRDLLHCFDLELPPDFAPRPDDGETEAFELWPMARVIETVAGTDRFKFNVNLVLIALFERLGLA